MLLTIPVMNTSTASETITIADTFQTYDVTGPAIWASASVRWYSLSRAYTRGRLPYRLVSAMNRCYRVVKANAPLNRYGFKVDHTGRVL